MELSLKCRQLTIRGDLTKITHSKLCVCVYMCGVTYSSTLSQVRLSNGWHTASRSQHSCVRPSRGRITALQLEMTTVVANLFLASTVLCLFVCLFDKKAVLSQGEPRDAAVNFDTYRILQ